jgi:hypothetical protein
MSPTPTPDYTSYTLAELEDIERHIDRNRFPDRYALVVAEIARKRSLIWTDDDDPPGVVAARRREISVERREMVRRAIAIFELALGLLIALWTPLMKEHLGAADDPSFELFVQISIVMGVLLAIAGVLVLMKSRFGFYFSLLLQVAMFPAIITDRPLYVILFPFNLFIWLRYGTPVPHSAVGLNMLSVAVLGVLVWFRPERGGTGES